MDRRSHDRRMIEESRKIEKAHDKKLQINRGRKLTGKQIECLEIISDQPDIGNKELMMLLGITISTLKDHLVPLQIRGLITYKSGFRGLKSYRVNKSNMKKIMLIN